ncbi:Imm58 family immunity protein [Gracilimonas sp.]|uniref:Imm58 family immunity protein n=1 Tax=Gracilimonas sp. TaxID=1974203 RepID=UPI003BAB9132
MKNWKTLFFSSLVLLVVTNLFWLYKSLDYGVSLTYQEDSYEKQKQVIGILGDLIVEGAQDYSKKDVLFLLRQKYPDGFIVEEENKVIYEGIYFDFENDSLVSITENW